MPSYEGGAWPHGESLGKQCMYALSVIGRRLPAKYKELPLHWAADERRTWANYKGRAAAHYEMRADDVEHAMFIMFPLIYKSGSDEHFEHLFGSPCICLGAHVRHKDSPAKLDTPRKGGWSKSKTVRVFKDRDDYYKVNVGKCKYMYVHRLVLFAMAGLPNGVEPCGSRNDYPTQHDFYANFHAFHKDTGALGEVALADFDERMRDTQCMHLCDDKTCCNWLHLTWGSKSYNTFAHKAKTQLGDAYEELFVREAIDFRNKHLLSGNLEVNPQSCNWNA